MKLFAPNYYKEFKCMASRCSHNCCIGWEIDVDEVSLEKYKKVDGEFGKKLAESIEFQPLENGGEQFDNPHFKLGEDERCPFLNSENLCEIIINCGENHLCQICADHPRFRNFYENSTEIGLGLCCEAAAEIALFQKEKMTIELLRDDGYSIDCDPETEQAEIHFFAKRKRAFDILQDRQKTLEQRFYELAKSFDFTPKKLQLSEQIDFYLSLEILDPAWEQMLEKYKYSNKANLYSETSNEIELPLEQLAVYLVFRHLASEQAVYDGDDTSLCEGLAFCVHAVNFVRNLLALTAAEKGELTRSDVVEIVRMYSSEIEYSEDNTQALREWCIS